jgi:hypothetical protein
MAKGDNMESETTDRIVVRLNESKIGQENMSSIKQLIRTIVSDFGRRDTKLNKLEQCIVSFNNAEILERIQIHFTFESDDREWDIFITRISIKDGDFRTRVQDLSENELNAFFISQKMVIGGSNPPALL